MDKSTEWSDRGWHNEKNSKNCCTSKPVNNDINNNLSLVQVAKYLLKIDDDDEDIFRKLKTASLKVETILQVREGGREGDREMLDLLL